MSDIQTRFCDLMTALCYNYILCKQGKKHLPLSKELIETFDKLNISEENYKDYALAVSNNFYKEGDKTNNRGVISKCS